MSKNKIYFGKQQEHEHTAEIGNVEVANEVVEEVIETPIEETVNNAEISEEIVETPVEEIVETPVEEIIENKNIIGIVSGCELLNVRSKPEFTADVLTILPVESMVTIIDVDASSDFYEVLIGDLKGFCMKKFIKIKE